MPYAPGIQSTSAQSLQAGISAGAGRLADWALKLADDSKKAKGLRSVVKAYYPDLEADGLGLRELEGMVQAGALKQAQEAAKAKAAMEERKLQMEGQELKLREDEARYRQDPSNPANTYNRSLAGNLDRQGREAEAQAGKLAQFNSGMAAESKRLGTIGLTPGANETMRLAGEAGILGTPEGDRLVTGQLRLAERADNAKPALGPGEFDEDPKTGNRFYRNGNQVLPSGTSRTAGSGSVTAEPVTAPDGTVLGHAVRNPNGTTRMVPPAKTMTASDQVKIYELIQKREDVLGYEKDPNRIAQLKADVQRLRSLVDDEPAPAATGAKGKEAAPAPAKSNLGDMMLEGARIKADLKSGKIKREAAEAALKKIGFK